MNNGFALYSREGELFFIPVAYEYPINKFVGFSENDLVYKISKLNDNQKNWLKNNDPKINEKTKNIIFVGDYYLKKLPFENFPKGKPYTQLPGGGGVFKETRKYNFVNDLFYNPTIIKAIEKYGVFSENYKTIKKLIKESVDEYVKIKQEKPKVSFTAVLVEDEKEIKKIKKIFDMLSKKGLIPKDFKEPIFSNGNPDYHMTVKLGELPVMFKRDLDKEVELNINSIGISKDAVALGVSGDYFSINKFQHITIAFKSLPEMSKNIENWIPLKKIIKVIGILRELDLKKEIIKRGVF